MRRYCLDTLTFHTILVPLSYLWEHFLQSRTVDGQNSWELGGVEMGVFKDYLGESDKIDGNWV